MQSSPFRNSPLSMAVFAALAVLPSISRAQERPKITGISHIAVYTSDPAATEHFYRQELGATKESDLEDSRGTVYRLSEQQFIEVLPLPAEHSITRLDHVAFETPDANALHGYLVARQYHDVDSLKTGSDGSKWFFTRDPEGNRVQFVQSAAHPFHASASLASPHIIHVGFLVKDRAAEDRFYRDLLGFRPYWYGAMHEGAVDWISQQVPDGHDWLEYMMVGPGSTVPIERVDANQLGVLNHFSLGVANMEAAVTKLLAEGRVKLYHAEPKMPISALPWSVYTGLPLSSGFQSTPFTP